MPLDVKDRRIIVDNILDNVFVPALVKKLDPFIEAIVQKRIYKNEWAKMTGCEIMNLPSVKLDIKPELNLLSDKLCEVFKNNGNN